MLVDGEPPTFCVPPEDDRFPLVAHDLLVAAQGARRHAVREDRCVAGDLHALVTRDALEHPKAVTLPLGELSFIGRTRP